MATVGNRAIAYVAAPDTPTAYGQSAFQTVTIDFRTAENVRLNWYGVQDANVSAPPELDVYRSADGGVSFESIAMSSVAFTLAASAVDRKTLAIDGGLYALVMQSGGPNTATLGIETCEILTGYVGV